MPSGVYYRTEQNRKNISLASKGRPSYLKGKTWEEVYGEETASKMKEAWSNRLLGKLPPNTGKSKYPDIDKTVVYICKCGCNEEIEVKPHYRYTGVPDFKYHHQSKDKQIVQKIKDKRATQAPNLWTDEQRVKHSNFMKEHNPAKRGC